MDGVAGSPDTPSRCQTNRTDYVASITQLVLSLVLGDRFGSGQVVVVWSSATGRLIFCQFKRAIWRGPTWAVPSPTWFERGTETEGVYTARVYTEGDYIEAVLPTLPTYPMMLR